jgi:hypothetical protein
MMTPEDWARIVKGTTEMTDAQRTVAEGHAPRVHHDIDRAIRANRRMERLAWAMIAAAVLGALLI